MAQFKQARRSAAELTEAKQELDNLFIEAVRKGGVNSSSREYNPRGIEKLEQNKFELAALIVQVIEDEVNVTDPAPFLVTERDAVLGDDHIFQEIDAALRVFKRSPGSKPLSQRLAWKEWGIASTQKEVAVEVPLEEVAVGRTTPSLVAQHIAWAINRARIGTLLDAIDAGVPAATDDRTGVSGYTLRYSGFGAQGVNLNRALDGMWDDGNAPTIMGRHIALFPTIRGFTGYSDDKLREFELRGVTGMHNGAPIVSLQDKYAKYAKSHVIRADRVYIAGGEKGAIRLNRDVAFLNWAMTDARTATFGTGVRYEDGVLVWDPYRYRIIEL